MIWKILLSIGVVIAVLIVVVSLRPSRMRIERSLAMAAAPQVVFQQVNDFHAWAGWSPWEKMDPQMKKTFSGASSGAGAIYAWSGNNKVGEGRMTIEKSHAPSTIVIKLEFFRPWQATNAATFTFTPTGGGTTVTWAMDCTHNFMAKFAGLFMNFDTMIGGDFEKGLAAMKAIAEGKAVAV